VLLVDEPFVGLDASGKVALLELLDEVSSTGDATVVVATHQLDYAARAQRCIALRDGELIHDGPADLEIIEELVKP
jgi:zinc/manganese transport system ATP-binding protein